MAKTSDKNAGEKRQCKSAFSGWFKTYKITSFMEHSLASLGTCIVHKDKIGFFYFHYASTSSIVNLSGAVLFLKASCKSAATSSDCCSKNRKISNYLQQPSPLQQSLQPATSVNRMLPPSLYSTLNP